ncbi:MAG: hypothetical protein AB1646_24590 [Thermodesulfobacteriota bacterium]
MAADTKAEAPDAQAKPEPSKDFPADHPNHVWSADLSTVRTWIFFRTEALAVIDHFSRKLVALVPLRNADTIVAALKTAFQLNGCPKRCCTTSYTTPLSR